MPGGTWRLRLAGGSVDDIIDLPIRAISQSEGPLNGVGQFERWAFQPPADLADRFQQKSLPITLKIALP
jgi:hypothetical protein